MRFHQRGMRRVSSLGRIKGANHERVRERESFEHLQPVRELRVREKITPNTQTNYELMIPLPKRQGKQSLNSASGVNKPCRTYHYLKILLGSLQAATRSPKSSRVQSNARVPLPLGRCWCPIKLSMPRFGASLSPGKFHEASSIPSWWCGCVYLRWNVTGARSLPYLRVPTAALQPIRLWGLTIP